MRASRAGRKGAIEIKIEPCIEFEFAFVYFYDVDLMVALDYDNTRRNQILIEEIIRYDQPLLILAKVQVMRS
jgi:hypothetical protein